MEEDIFVEEESLAPNGTEDEEDEADVATDMAMGTADSSTLRANEEDMNEAEGNGAMEKVI